MVWILYPLIGWLTDAHTNESFFGMSLVACILIIINPPSLYILKKIKNRKVYEMFSLFINIIDITCYTALVYYAGGIRTNHFILTYAGVIAYVGVSAPRRITLAVAIISMVEYNVLIMLEHFNFLAHQNPQFSYDFHFIDAQIIGISASALFAVVAFMSVSTGTVLRRNRNNLHIRNLELDKVNKIAKIGSKSLDMDLILNSICRELTMLFPVHYVGIALNEKGLKKMRIVAYYSNESGLPNLIGETLHWAGDEKFWTDMGGMKPLVFNNDQKDQRSRYLNKYLELNDISSILFTPLISHGKPFGAIGMPPVDQNYIFSENDINLIQTISSQISSIITNTQVYAKTESALLLAERDLEIGRQIQTGFLPTTLPQIEGWEVASFYLPARQVAGDFYDAFPVNDQGAFTFLVGDVCDKGVGAALFMVVFRSLIKSFSLAQQPNKGFDNYLLEIITTVNGYISKTHDRENMFATLFMGLIDPKTNQLYYINAGHEIPSLINHSGNIKSHLEPTGPAIGLAPDMNFKVKSLPFNKGDSLLIFTDGVTDARNSRGKPFTEKTLLDIIQSPTSSAISTVTQVELKIKDHIRHVDQFDDIAMLCVHRTGQSDKQEHVVNTKSTIEKLPVLRDFIEKAGKAMEMPAESIFSFKLSLDEIVTNINEHGYVGLLHGPLRLKFKSSGDIFSLEIEDEGVAYDYTSTPEVDVEASLEERSAGGLGLFLVQEAMDSTKYQRINERINRITLIKENNSKGVGNGY